MKKIIAGIFIALAFIAVAGIWAVWSPGAVPEAAPPVQIRVGTVPTAASTLIYIADDEHFFEKNGLDITVTDYSTGTATTDALLAGNEDLVWVAEFPMVRRAFEGDEISIIAVVDRFNEQHIFGRKDRGISTAADLPGKKIGIPRNTIAEFYLGRYLQLHGMGMRDVPIVDVAAKDSLDALTSGMVDGVISWEPFSSQIRAQMADRIVALPIQSNQPGFGTIAARNDWIRRNPDIATRFLRSLAQAEEFADGNPTAAKAIVRKHLDYDDAFTETIWSENQLSLSLDQSLITAMEDEARWMIAHNMTNATTVPDFRRYINTDMLESVKPGSVNIIR